MGRGLIGRVLELLTNAGGQAEVKTDSGGGDTATALTYTPAGIDSKPLVDDYAVMVAGTRTDEGFAIAFYDQKLEDDVEDGETRVYSRESAGTLAASILLKKDGNIEIESIGSGSVITLNGVTIDQDGNITSPAEVTATGATGTVALSTHLHNTAMGPTAPPTGGT